MVIIISIIHNFDAFQNPSINISFKLIQLCKKLRSSSSNSKVYLVPFLCIFKGNFSSIANNKGNISGFHQYDVHKSI